MIFHHSTFSYHLSLLRHIFLIIIDQTFISVKFIAALVINSVFFSHCLKKYLALEKQDSRTTSRYWIPISPAKKQRQMRDDDKKNMWERISMSGNV